MSEPRGTRGGPRTLGDELRARSDEQLAELLRVRPDLLSPLPGDLSQLATRATARPSVLRALDRLDTFTLQTAEALAVLTPPTRYAELAALLPGGDERLPAAVDTLRARALLWGGPDAMRLVRTVQEVLAPGPQRPGATGLGPGLADTVGALSPRRAQELLATLGLPSTADPVGAARALATWFAEPARPRRLLAEAPDGAQEVLDRLLWGPPHGEVTAQPAPHLRWLLDRAFLVPTAPGTVVLPREVALALRGGRAHRDLAPLPPPVDPHATHPVARVDATAAGTAQDATGRVESLLSLWEREPPPVLRNGGLGVRELKRTATELDLAEPEAVFWIELAYAAGLVAADGQPDDRYVPTPAADDWLTDPAQDRWARLVSAWLATTRVATVVGERAPRPTPARGGRAAGGERMLAALGPGLDRGPAPEIRRRVLELVADLPPGAAPDPAALRDRLRWEAPRRVSSELLALLCASAVTEAERLGVTSQGALADFARPLVRPTPPAGTGAAEAAGDPGPAAAARLLAAHVPDPVDHVLLQADLTAIAPGPLVRELATALALAADVESTGGATVYRFTPASVRRALDAGWTAEELRSFLADRSRTPLPQPLAYLVDDVARRYGQLRAGPAAGYLRCDDEALLTQLLSDRRLAPLGLRRLATTVAISPLAPEDLLARLREEGYAPAAEGSEGAAVTAPATGHRSPPRRAPEPQPDSPPPADDRLLGSAVRAIRAGDHATAAAAVESAGGRRACAPGGSAAAEAPAVLPRTSPEETRAALRSAADGGTLVWIGHVGAEGVACHRLLAPVRVDGGLVTAYDHTAEEVRTYPLHRVTGAVAATP